MNAKTILAALLAISVAAAGCRSSKTQEKAEEYHSESAATASTQYATEETAAGNAETDTKRVVLEFRSPDSTGRTPISRITVTATKRKEASASEKKTAESTTAETTATTTASNEEKQLSEPAAGRFPISIIAAIALIALTITLIKNRK